MKTITLELRKRHPHTGVMDIRKVDLTDLEDILTPQEVFQLEFKMNEIPSIRAHISINEETEKQYFDRLKKL